MRFSVVNLVRKGLLLFGSGVCVVEHPEVPWGFSHGCFLFLTEKGKRVASHSVNIGFMLQPTLRMGDGATSSQLGMRLLGSKIIEVQYDA